MKKYFLEIRNRLVLLLLTWFSTLAISYFYKDVLLFLMLQPNRLLFLATNFDYSTFYFIFTNVTEVFFVYIKLVTFISFQVFLCFLIYQFFVFFAPAIFKSEYNFLSFFFKTFLAVWFFSILITSFFLVPLSWNFFLSFQSLVSSKFAYLHFEAKLSEYLSFYILIYYIGVFYCQFFTVLFVFLNYANDKHKTIKKYRKTYYYSFVIFSTIVSPPDVYSQVVISIILIFTYEFLVIGFMLKNVLIWKPVKTNQNS